MTKYLKALFALAGVALTGIQTAYVAGNGHIGWKDAISILLGVSATGASVWGVPNSTPAVNETTPVK